MYYNFATELAMARFQWENLPGSCDERFLEIGLHNNGYSLFFEDEVMGFLCLNGSLSGKLDVYNIPTQRRAFASNGYSKNLTQNDSVIIYNNAMHTPTDYICRLYAYRMYNVERGIDVNVQCQKTPKIILCDEQQRLTMENLMLEYQGNIPFIYGDRNLEIEMIKSLDTTAPYVADKLETLKHCIWNEFLTFIGIENSNQDKKERLVADEVGSNYGNVEASRFIYLNARQQAAEKINRMFGLDITVKYRSELDTMLNNPNRRGEENVDIYNTGALDSGKGSE